MAQIRKFTNGGTAEKTKPETWGKIYKNGTPYQVHDDTLRWLEGQGSIGQEMANELRSGVDQHIEIGSDGVGLIKNISTGMENLSYKHRKRLNRKQGLFNGLFESSTVRGTRDIVQGIADMNYEKFSDQRTPFDFGNIDLEYIATPGENGISYSFNSTSNNNAKALQRLNKIINDGKIIIPEGQKWDNNTWSLEDANKYIETYFDTIKGLTTKIKENNLNEEDKTLLKQLGITYTTPTTAGGQSIEELEKDRKNAEALEKAKATFASQLGIENNSNLLNLFNYEIEGDQVYIKPTQQLLKKFGNNYMFSEYDEGDFAKLSGFVLLDGKLEQISDAADNSLMLWDKLNDFKSLIQQHKFGEARKLMNFALPKEELSQGWSQHNSTKGVSLFNLPHGTYYRDWAHLAQPGTTAIYVTAKGTHPYLPTFKRMHKQIDGQTPASKTSNEDTSIKNEEPAPTTINYESLNINGKVVKTIGKYKVSTKSNSTIVTFSPDNNTIYIKEGSGWREIQIKFDGDNLSKIKYFKTVLNNAARNLKDLKNYNEAKVLRIFNPIYFPEYLQGKIEESLSTTPKYYKSGGVLDIKKFASGGLTSMESEEESENEVKNKSEIPLTWGHVSEGDFTPHDVAELGALVSDVFGYALGHSGNPKVRFTSKIVNGISDALYAYSLRRDGEWDADDMKQIGINVGLSYGPYFSNSSKAQRFFRALYTVMGAAGVLNAESAIKNMLDVVDRKKSLKEIPVQDLTNIWQGIKGLRGISRNIREVRVANKYLKPVESKTSAKSDVETSTNAFLSKFKTKEIGEIMKKSVDQVINSDNNALDIIKNSTFFDANTNSIKSDSYAGAFNLLDSKGFITTKLLYDMAPTKPKNTKLENVKKDILTGGKKAWALFSGIDPSKYTLSDDFDPDKVSNSRHRRILNQFAGQYPTQYAQWLMWDSQNNGRPPLRPGENSRAGDDNATSNDRLDGRPIDAEAQRNNQNTSETNTQTRTSEEPPTTNTQEPALGPFDIKDIVVVGNKVTGFPDQLDSKTIEALDSNPIRKNGKIFVKKVHITNPLTRKKEIQYHVLDPENSLGRTWAIYDEAGFLKRKTEYANQGVELFEPKKRRFWEHIAEALSPTERYIPGQSIDNRHNGGKILKAGFGIKFHALKQQGKSDKEALEIISKDPTISKWRKKRIALDLDGTFDTNGNLVNNIYGNRDPEQKNLFGVISPWVEYGITSGGNKKVLDKRTAAKRAESIGAMESMPTKKPTVNLNINPITTEYENQAADAWSKTTNVNQALSDSRQRIANSTNTMSNIMKGGSDLSTKISNVISDKNTQDLKNDWEYSELERKIASHNQKAGAQTEANILNLEADHTEKEYSNATKLLAEFRADQDNYMKAKRSKSLYNNIIKLQNKLAYEKLSKDERETIYQQIATYQKLIDSINIYNKFTGKYAVNIKDKNN